jgi:hypothetical protein
MCLKLLTINTADYSTLIYTVTNPFRFDKTKEKKEIHLLSMKEIPNKHDILVGKYLNALI